MTPFLGLSLSDASTFAPRENAIFFTLLWTSVAVFGILTVAVLGFLVRYRHTAKVDRSTPKLAPWKIELSWTVATTVIFLGFFAWGSVIFRDMESPPEGASEISITGRQWMWDVRHPDGRREFDSVHVIVNEPVRLNLSSEDVIHSFFVPAFRVKQDVVPGKSVSAWFTPTKTGSYALYCAQYCGSAHSQMIGTVVVLDKDAYQAWDRAQARPQALTDGRYLFKEFGCAGCHGSLHPNAPDLAGLYGSTVHLSDGTFIRADEAYLHDHLMAADPPRVAGYPALMPRFRSILTENQAYALVSYLRTLRSANDPGPRS